MSRGTFLHKIMSATGTNLALALFGVEGHNQTFTDIQVSNLLTPGKADKASRKNAKYNSGGIAEVYLKAHRAFQRDYRKKYSAKFMERQGYAPTSTAYTRVNDEAKTELYLESLYGYLDVAVESSRDKYLTITEKGRHAIQTLMGYDFATGNVIDGGTYALTEYTEDTFDTTVLVHMKRDYIESIEDNLYANYAYNGSEVTILGEQYTIGMLSSTLNASDEYETICTHVGSTLPEEVILTPAERKTYSVSNPAYGTEASHVSYRVISGEVGTELRYWVDLADTRDIYVKKDVAITTIVPMKEDNVMIDLEDAKLERMLKKLNLSGEQLLTSLENPGMDGAYLMTGLDPQYNDNTSNTTMLKAFDYLSEGGSNIVVSISKLSMKYSFSMTKEIISGSIGAIGTATKTFIPRVPAAEVQAIQAGMILRLQVDSNEYKEITVTDFIQEYTISGQVITSYLDSTGGYCRIVIPLDVLNALKYRDFEHVYERSLCLLSFSTETVYVEWYETAAFGTLLKVIAIALLVWSFGTSTDLSAWLWSMASSMAIMFVASEIGKMIGGTLGAIVGAIIAVVGMSINPYIVMNSTEIWLMSAQQTLGVVNQHIQHEMAKLLVESDAYFENMKNKMEELEKDQDAMDEKSDTAWALAGFDSSYAGRGVTSYQSIEQYCSGVVDSTDLSYLVDYGEQIRNTLNTRNGVVAGVD